MSYVPPFLTHLGLEGSADERAVRRAYAQQLKAIDPEVDPAGFQALHETFEAAKRWTRHRAKLAEAEAAETLQPEEHFPPDAPSADAHAEQGPSDAPANMRSTLPIDLPPEPKAEVAPETPAHTVLSLDTSLSSNPPAPAAQSPRLTTDQLIVDEVAVSAAVFAGFAGRFAELAGQMEIDDLEAVRQELQQALDDPRLINLQVRTSFERSIGQLLAGGWRPGHHLLFEVAVELFHWMEDRRRLDGLGGYGPFLNRAVLEYAVFLKSPDAQSKYRKGLIARMRNANPPEWQELDTNIKTLEALFARYPNWFRVVTDMQNIAMWREKERTPVNLRENRVDASSKISPQTEKGAKSFGFFMAMLMLFFTISHFFGGTSTPDYSQQYRPNQAGVPVMNYGAPEQPIPYAWAKPPIIDNIRYSKTQMQQAFDQINTNVRYPVSNVRVANIPANFVVELAPDGTVNRVEKTASSARLEYDEAVRKAILKGQPYPTVAGQTGPALLRLSAFPYKK